LGGGKVVRRKVKKITDYASYLEWKLENCHFSPTGRHEWVSFKQLLQSVGVENLQLLTVALPKDERGKFYPYYCKWCYFGKKSR
jgi:hypothetical protein